MANEGAAFFDVDSRLLFELGEQLVTNRAIALAELVKNAYDADATNVVITLQNVKSPGGVIIIEDNGIGIDELKFKESWMRIATIYSEKNPNSTKFNRKKSGKKGIGRFACRKLSKNLNLISVSEQGDGSKLRLNAFFDWDSFIPGSDVDKIPIKFFIESVERTTPTGTILRLEKTTESWTERNISRLKSELNELFTPIIYEEKEESLVLPEGFDPGFHFNIISNEFAIEQESLDKSFFKQSWAKVIGSVDDTGIASYTLAVQNKILTKFSRDFERETPFSDFRCGKLEFYIFSYRPDLFFNSDWKLNQAAEIGRNRGGIRVYADDFRIFGYGDVGNDWLNLDYDRARSRPDVDSELVNLKQEAKRPGLLLFRNPALFGYVTFNQNKNPNLEILINRDRLNEESKAFHELRKFVRVGVDFATVLYANEIEKEIKLQENKEEEKKKEREKILREAEEDKRKAEEERKKVQEEVKKAEEKEWKASQDRINAKKNRENAEEERRRAEKRRRDAEKYALLHKGKDPWLRVEKERKIEEEKIFEEAIARELEELKQKEEEEAKRTAESKKQIFWTIAKESLEGKRIAEEKIIIAREEELNQTEQKYQDEFSKLRVLASTGTLIHIFSHEIQALIEDMQIMQQHFLSVLEKLPKGEQEYYRKDLDTFNNRIEMINEFGQFIGLTIGRESRTGKKRWVLKPILYNVFSPFKWQLENRGIEFRNTIPDALRSPYMYRSEIASIFHNLMSNAIKAVTNMPERRIEVTGGEWGEKSIFIRFLDSGKGLDKNKWEIAFEAFESYSEPDIRYGAGTGLGLKLVKDFVQSYGGKVYFTEPPENWNTCIEIILPMVE